MPADFLSFYAAYPKHVDKAEAAAVWARLTNADALPPLADLLAAVERHKRGRQWRDGFVMSPRRWLLGRHWEDEEDDARPTLSRPNGASSSAVEEHRRTTQRLRELANGAPPRLNHDA